MKIYYLAPRILQTFIWVPTRLAFILFAQVKIRGKENLKGLTGGVIFASNHASEMDPIVTPATLTPFSPLFPMFYVSRSKDFYNTSGWKQKIYGGLFFALWGAYPVYTGRGSYEKALKNHIEILSKKKSIHIFPEGGKSKTGKMSDKIYGGVTFLAWKSGVPVVPVAIKGVFKTSLKLFFTGRKRYSITYGKPIYPTEFFKDTSKEPTMEDFKKIAVVIMQEVKKMHKDM